MKLIVKVKSYYGKRFFYPACDKSRLVGRLVRRETLTERDVSLLKELGFEIVSESETI